MLSWTLKQTSPQEDLPKQEVAWKWKQQKEHQSSSSWLDRSGVGAELIMLKRMAWLCGNPMRVKFNLNFLWKWQILRCDFAVVVNHQDS